MSVSTRNGSPDKCCDDVNMQAPPQGGGNPPLFVPSEQWDICYGVGGNVVSNQTGPTLGEQVANMFSDLKPDCRQAFMDALNSAIDSQTNQIILNTITNPNLQCPPGQCRSVIVGLLDSPSNGQSAGSVKVCCKDGELDMSNGDPTAGWVVGATNFGRCG